VIGLKVKAGDDFDSLAKHKLLYPAVALRGGVPEYMPLVPDPAAAPP
jgi:hypothetical protein